MRGPKHFIGSLSAKTSKYLNKISTIRNRRLILESGIFDSTFCCPSWNSEKDPAQWYLDQYRVGSGCRKPMPGFHPGIYAEHVDTTGIDPFVHFLKSGQPTGPWHWKVISPTSEAFQINRPEFDAQCALHIHLYYHDQAEALFKTLALLQLRPDLKISVTSNECRDYVIRLLESMGRFVADVRVTPNCGRDIGPFLTEFGSELSKYKFIGHIHAKDSALVGDRALVHRWVNFLTENLLHGRSPMADIILSHFEENPRLGIVFPDDPYIFGWTENMEEAKRLALSMKLKLPLPSSINFPMGNMFWARPEALAPLFDLNLGWDDYPKEPLPYDGTMLHAIERLLPLIARHAGYECAVTHVPGVSR